MLEKRLTWEEIKRNYPDKWVAMSQIEWKDDANVRSAIVVGASDDNNDFLRRQFAGEDVFTRYTCPWNLY